MWEELKGEIDAYAIENVEVERNRIHSILSNFIVMKEEITQEVLSKVILGNLKEMFLKKITSLANSVMQKIKREMEKQ